MIVAIPREERAPLAEDEIYIGDLIGCMLVDVAGTEPVAVGEIEDVDRSGGAGSDAGGARKIMRRRNAGSLCEELSAAGGPRSEARGDGAA